MSSRHDREEFDARGHTGPFQIGQGGVSCDAGSGNVWSAAYAPPSTSTGSAAE